MDRIEAINLFIRKRGYRRYLEIGCFADACFSKVQAEVKVGVDPISGGTVRMHSDGYFRIAKQEGAKFDLIFIDGDKHHDQVFRDIMNAIDCLAPGGAVMVHDCLPPSASYETSSTGAVQFCGTVWRAFAMFRQRYDLDAFVGDFDYGVGLIRKIPNPLPISIGKSMDSLTYADFVANRDAWMRPQPSFVFDMIADRPWGIPSVAMMVIGKSDEEIAWFKEKTPHAADEARMVYVSNPGRKFGATAVIANPFIESATEDVVAIVHADTTFAPGAIRAFAEAAINNDSVTGIVGRIKPYGSEPEKWGYVWCHSTSGFVSTLDSCSVFMRPSWGLRFDGATFNDFHCVVEDICLQARKKGIRSLVPHIQASHVGTATEGTWQEHFWRFRQKLLDKYPDEEIHTV